MNILLIELIVVFSQGIISGMFFQIFCNRRECRRLTILGWTFFFAFQLFIIFVDCIVPDILLIVGMYFVWSELVYEGVFLKKAFFSFVLILFGMISEVLFVFVDREINYHIPLSQAKIIALIILFVFVVLLRTIITKKNGDEDKYEQQSNLYLIFISVGSIGIILTMAYLESLSNKKVHPLLIIVSSLVILIMNIFIFSLYNLQAKHLEAKRCNTVYRQQIILHENYMKERELIWNQIREKQHDFNNNLLVLEQLIVNRDNGKALEFIEEIGRNRLQITNIKVVKSDNVIVDTIVNYKAEVAKEYEINLDTDIHIPIELKIKSSDLCIILGNLLDNAIEALRCKTGDKVIKFIMRYDNDNLFIIIENGFVGKRKKKLDGSYITTKKDMDNHGIGLTSIKKIVNSYQGVMEIQDRASQFKVSISLFF